MLGELTPQAPNVCEHGSLNYKCEICDRDTEIMRLRAQVHGLTLQLQALRTGKTLTCEWDLSLAEQDGIVRDRLIELGWTPPA